MVKDAFYIQRMQEMHESITSDDTIHDTLIKFGWEDISDEKNPDLYRRPAYMGKERKEMSSLYSMEESSIYAREYRCFLRYKSYKNEKRFCATQCGA